MTGTKVHGYKNESILKGEAAMWDINVDSKRNCVPVRKQLNSAVFLIR